MNAPDPAALDADLAVLPTDPADLAELSAFLREGFGGEQAARLFSTEMLRWKYFARDLGLPASFVAKRNGHIVGHLGRALRTLSVPDATRNRPLLAAHFLDWLVPPDSRGAGALLLLRGLSGADLAYLLGGSAEGQAVSRAAGFTARPGFPIMRRVLRPLYRFRSGAVSLRSALAAARDTARLLSPAPLRRAGRWDIEPVARFGGEVDEILARFPEPRAITERGAALLNHMLACPGTAMSGWLLRHAGRLRGFALLNVVETSRGRFGRLVECQLDTPGDMAAWSAAVAALTAQLGAQGSDAATCYAGMPALAAACRANGYHVEREQRVFVRDRAGLLPPGLPFHFSQIEADHALH